MSINMKQVFELNPAKEGMSWFSTEMLENGDAIVDIKGVIGDWDVDENELATKMQENDENPTVSRHIVRIDSPGGIVSAGVSLMSSISQLNKPVVCEIWGSCYSMATMVAVACDEVKIAKDASFMIHNPRGIAFGTASEMKATLQYLENVREQAVERYSAKVEGAGHTREEIDAAMTDAGTYYTALQTIEMGFADVMMEDKRESKMQIDAEFAAVMLAEAPEEIELNIASEEVVEEVADAEMVDEVAEVKVEEVKEEVVEVEMKTLDIEIDEKTFSVTLKADDADAFEANFIKEQTENDTIVAEMKSGSDEEPVVARIESTEAGKSEKPGAAKMVNDRIAAHNKNFGRF